MSFDKIRVIRFADGSQIVACLEKEYDLSTPFLNLMYPIEIYSGGVDEDEDYLSESYMLKGWMGLSDDVAFTVATSSIVVVAKLIESHITGYEQCVKKIFFEDKQQRATTNSMADALSPDDLLDYIEAKNNNKIN
jgi:hypothetical protein